MRPNSRDEPQRFFVHKAILIACILLASALPAKAQFTQYTAPGSLSERPEDRAEVARRAAEDARWRIGPLRVEPQLTLSNLSYDQNVFAAPEGTEQVDDRRATAGAGLTGYLRMGPKSLLSGFVAPEYSIWQETENLNHLAVNSGLAWFGFFNRLQLTATARSTERERSLSNELEVPVQISEDGLTFDTEIEITRRLALFLTASDARSRHGRDSEQFVPGLDLRGLDRDDNRTVVGIELRKSAVEIGLGWETTDVDFVESDQRDNGGEGVFLRLNYERNRLTVDLDYADLQLDFPAGDSRSGRQEFGKALAALKVRPETTVSLYAARGLSFTVISTTGVIEFQTWGLALRQGLGERLEATVFAESGREEFLDSLGPSRIDDREAIGINLEYELTQRLSLTGRYREDRRNSTLEGFDRSTSTVGFGIRFAGDLIPW